MKTFWAEILRPGKWTSKGGRTVEFTGDTITKIIETFESLKADVRPVLRLGGHPDAQNLNPAVGWVTDLKLSEDGTLLAEFSDVPQVVADAIEKRRYRTVSPGLWGNWEYEGSTYDWVLNHVAILGGALPAISGLKDLEAFLSAPQSEALEAVGDVPEVVFSFTESEEEEPAVDEKLFNEMKEGREAAEEKVEGLETQVTELTTANESLTTERDEARAAVESLKGEIAEFRAAADKAEVEGLVKAAIADGRCLPKDKDRMVEIGLTMKAASVNFSSEEENAKSPFETWSDQLADGGKIVDFEEKGETGEGDDESKSTAQKDFEAGAAAAKTINEEIK